MEYVQPFDVNIWVAVLIAILSLVSILTLTSLSLDDSSTVYSGHYRCIASLAFYSISVLLENSFGKIQLPKRGKLINSISFLILAFMCVILGNLYKSVITTDMISPIKGTIPYETLSQLVLENFTLIVVPAEDLRVRRDSKSRYKDKVGLEVALRNSVVLDDASDLTKYLDHFLSWSGYFSDHDAEFNDNLGELKNSIVGRLRMFEYEEDALAVLASCGKKAFVGSAEEVVDFLKFNHNRVFPWRPGKRDS
jgi:hypothetical protein